MNQYSKILIVRTDRIGDVILSLPLATTIKKYFPGSRVTFLLREYTKDIVAKHPHVDNILTLIEKKGKTLLLPNILQIKKHQFDVCIVVSPTFKVALTLFLTGIKKRIGTGYRWYFLLFNNKIFEHRKYGERHELDYNMRMLKSLGIEESIEEDSVSFYIHVSHKSEHKVDDVLKNEGIDPHRPIVIIHPGSGGSAVNLPLKKFGDLVELLARELSISLLITGLDSEREMCESLVINEKVKNLAGLFSLSEMIALINRSQLLIANSTGPIHIAAALKKNVVGFYPKIRECSPRRWGPFTNKKVIFTPEIDCDNCTRKQCEELNCMNSINIDRVFESIKNILNLKITSEN